MLLILAIVSFGYVYVDGAPVSSADAELVAQAFLRYDAGKSFAYRMAVGVPEGARIEGATELWDPEAGDLLGYVFAIDPSGYVVVTTETELVPVIAYSYAGEFSWEENEENHLLSMLRLDLRWRLMALSEKSVPKSVSDSNEALWKAYLGTGEASGVGESTRVYGPLLATEWDQYSPYNDHCPVDPEHGGTSFVGCVAIALAQILNYWQYPTEVTLGSYVTQTHGWSIDGPAASFSDLNYAAGELSDEDKARLCYAAGVSVKTNYCSDKSKGSSASLEDVAAALAGNGPNCGASDHGVAECWGYASADVRTYSSDFLHWGSPYYVTEAEFFTQLSSDMVAAQPAVMAIHKYIPTYTGHAIVADGWQSGGRVYHLNWGGGSFSGWYSLPERMPSEYTVIDYAVLDIRPPAEPAANLFPRVGDLRLPEGTTVIREGTVTGIEEGDLYIPAGATLYLEQNSTFVWNPGYGIRNEGGQITREPGSSLRKGYLCVQYSAEDACWSNMAYCDGPACPAGSVRWKDVPAGASQCNPVPPPPFVEFQFEKRLSDLSTQTDFIEPGDKIRYTISLSSPTGGAVGRKARFVDVVDSAFDLGSPVMVCASDGAVAFDSPSRTLEWEGEVPALGATVTVFLELCLGDAPPGTIVSNQAQLLVDLDGDSVFDITIESGDPSTEQTGDPTRFQVRVPDWRWNLQRGDILYDPRALASLGHTGVYLGKGLTADPRWYECIHHISTWDYPARDEVHILRVNAPEATRSAAAQWAWDLGHRLDSGDDYSYQWEFIDKDPSADSNRWYCSELVWAAYWNQGIDIEHYEGPALTLAQLLVTPVSPDDICEDNDTVTVGGHCGGLPDAAPTNCCEPLCGCFLAGTPLGLILTLMCPADLEVTDPLGRVISSVSNEVPGAVYMWNNAQYEGDRYDVVAVPEPVGGIYHVRVIPEPDASPDDTYTLTVQNTTGSPPTILADSVPIDDIPAAGYEVDATCSRSTAALQAPAWHMVSLPGTLCDPCAWTSGVVCGDLVCALGDDIDPFYAFRYDADLRSYARVPPADQVCYQPGMGMWIYTWDADTEIDSEVTALTGNVELALQNGWNQVGNPYTFSIGTGSIRVRCGIEELSLTEAQAQGWITAMLFGYEAGAYVVIDPASGCLSAWTGCWLRAYRSDCTLVFQPVGCTSSLTQARPLSVAEARALELPPPPPLNPQALDIKEVLAGLSATNIPNPIRSEHTTVFRVEGLRAELVDEIRVDIYDLSGQRVFTEAIASQELAWHTVNDAGELLANGVYLYRVWVKVGEIWYPLEIQKLAVVR